MAGFKSGLEDDAKTHHDRPDAQRWLADAEAYGRMVAGLEAGEIVPDDHVRRLVGEWAEAHDRAEHYKRIVLRNVVYPATDSRGLRNATYRNKGN